MSKCIGLKIPHNRRDTTTFPRDLRQEVVNGLLYAHSRLNANTTKNLEAASFLYALIELLSEKGIISIEELDQRKRVVGERLTKQASDRGLGAMFQDPEYDKYAFKDNVEIDCENRVHQCGAACCRLPFALSKQDVREGILHWDLGQPYLIDQGDDGYCIHLDRTTFGCRVHKHRPVPCRAFDCRKDRRIWLDFENMIVNPDISRADWPQCLVDRQGKENHDPRPGQNPGRAAQARAAVRAGLAGDHQLRHAR